MTAGALLGFVGFMLIAFISSLWHGVLFPVFGFCAMLSLSLAVALNWVSFKTPTR